MSKYLFIGGLKDGEYVDVYDDNIGYWKIAESSGINFNQLTDYSMFKFEVKEHVYIKQYLSGNPVFVYDKVPDVMTTLLKGYRKRKYKPKSKIKIY